MNKKKYLIAYDIREKDRLQTFRRRLKDIGLTCQNSLFLVHMTPPELEETVGRLLQLVKMEQDDLRIYPFRTENFHEHYGKKSLYRRIGANKLMTVWAVTRHPGAKEWLQKNAQISIDHFVDHLNVELVNEGDTVLGVAPLSVIAALCKKGAKFYALDLKLSSSERGKELTRDRMERLNCTLKQYEVIEL